MENEDCRSKIGVSGAAIVGLEDAARRDADIHDPGFSGAPQCC